MEIKKQIEFSARGSSLLEMLLCTPLALLFLIVVIDSGGAYLQRASFADALRATLNSEFVYERGKTLLTLDDDTFSLITDERVATELVSGLSNELAQILREVQHYRGSETVSSFKVTVSAIAIDIDELTGALKSPTYRVLALSQTGNTMYESSSATPGYQGENMDEFLQKELRRQFEREVSLYAIPLGVRYLTSTGQAKPRYLSQAVLLYAQAEGYAHSIHSEAVKRMIGSLFAIDEKHLVLLRSQVS